ncbi:Tumor rejection antigen P815A [Lemmus lemmus]
MSDNKKPDQGTSGSDGKSDGNRCRLLEQYSMEEILIFLEWLVFFAAIAGFLAFQFIVNDIYEEEYERDVAWIAKQSRLMSPTYEEDEDSEDEDIMDDDLEDEDQEELETQMEEEEEGEDETRMEEGARATCLIDLSACTCKLPMALNLDSGSPGIPDRKLRKNIIRSMLLNFFRERNVLVSIPVQLQEPIECECEDADEEAAEEKEEEGDETEKLEGELNEDLDSAEGSLP